MYEKILNAKPGDVADIFENQLVQILLIFQPGHGFRKSHGIEVLSYIITKITGKQIDEFVKATLLRPLNMEDTDWYVTDENASRTTEQHLAVPAYTGKLGLYLTGEDEGHTSWLGWRTASTKRTAHYSCIGKTFDCEWHLQYRLGHDEISKFSKQQPQEQ